MSVPKLHPTVRYAEPEYWDSRYEREPSLFEWFFGHTALRRVIRAYISKKKPVLQIGCGTSNLQEGMAQSGYTVVNTDISTVVIKQMKERHAKYSNLSYVVSDCRKMPEFRDCQFGHVIDKGTIDALLCCKHGTDNVFAMLQETYRVLSPGGSFLLVTLGDPTRRLPLLVQPQLQWKVSVLMLPKISGAAQAYVDGRPINDTLRPIDADGPYEVLDAHTIVGLPTNVDYSNYFFAYVCKKQPLQLPLAQGERAQLPNGWVAGSKELFLKLQKELGLPEDLLDKGRRKRVMHVPIGSTRNSLSGTAAAVKSAISSSGNSSVKAAALGVRPAQDPQQILQEDQLLLQELTAGTPSVAQLQGQQRADNTQRHQQHAAHEAADSDLEALLSNAQRQDQTGAADAVEFVPARPQSAPNLADMFDSNSPAHDSGRASAVESNAASAAADGLLPPHLTATPAVPGTTAAVAAAIPLTAAQVPVTEALQQQESQHQGGASLDPGVVKHGAADADSAPAGAHNDSANLLSSMPACHHEDLSSRSLQVSTPAVPAAAGACAATAPRAPRAERATAAAKVRRFSTECSSHSLTAVQPQLVVLRKQQAQHSERAADGLVMHDVAASEACGSSSSAAAAATAAAVAGAVWGHTRSARDRRLSNVSAMSSFSVLSNTSISNTEEEEDSETEDDYVSLCTSGDSHPHGAQQPPDVSKLLIDTSICNSDKMCSSRQNVSSSFITADHQEHSQQQEEGELDATAAAVANTEGAEGRHLGTLALVSPYSSSAAGTVTCNHIETHSTGGLELQ